MTNIVLFLTDDHGAWANGCYGNSEIQTPTLDHLAATGIRFANAFTPTPVCSPGRACVMTGRTASQVGIHDWLQEARDDVGARDWLADEKTLFQYFKEAGYHTALCGKWHLGINPMTPRGLDYHFGLPGWQAAHNMTYTYTFNDQPVTLSGNKSGFITDYALQYLEQAQEPFFLNIGYIATHSPYEKQTHDSRLTALYEDATFRDIPEWNPHPWVRNEGGPNDMRGVEVRDRYIGYYAAATEIDNNVRRVLDKLDELGLAGDTIIIYTSDHGCSTGHHGFWGKGNSTRPLNMYEVSLRVPLIWSGAGIESGQVVENCVDHYDTFQAILATAGITPDANTTGDSYRAQLEGQTVAWDDTRYGEYGDLRMIRTPEWKLVVRYPDGPHDLFHLADDPGETVNLIDQHPEVVADLRSRLDAFYADHEDPAKSGLKVKDLPGHNNNEAWRDGLREGRGFQVY